MQKGQIILALILIMTVALAIGLSIVQKSLTDVSTATKVEQSSRAFSAAEGGVEKYLSANANCTPQTCNVQFSDTASSATVQGGNLIPVVPASGTRQDPLEYPPLAKEEVAQIWLADFNSSSNPPSSFYAQNSLDIYWGNSSTDKAALELTLVYYDGNQYKARKWYLDQTLRNPANNFQQVAACGGLINNYQCKFTVGASGDSGGALPQNPILARARLLYNTTSQPLAVQAVGTCGQNCSLPPQAKIITSTGITGETQRKVRVFQIQKVVPPYFDYAIFSAGDIRK